MPRTKSWFDRIMVGLLPLVPRPLLWRVASRYVAGKTLSAAMARCRRIMELGARVTLDVLGEEIEHIEAGEQAVRSYFDVLDAIREEGIDGNISVKLTAFGLKLDEDVTYARVRSVVSRARDLGNFVRIDMEDSSCTTATLAIYRRLREEGFDNVGVVLQAYMRRSMDDVRALADLAPNYRLCKGIYIEPEEVAFQDPEEINQNYVALLQAMLDGGSYVGIATHDRVLVDAVEETLRNRELAKEAYEFQMLLGVDQALGMRILGAGHALRIYVPFGEKWHAYCVRRLQENPQIGRYVLKGMFTRQ